MKNFVLKSIIGVMARLLLLAPLIAELVYTGKYASQVSNVATFVLVVIALMSLLYLVVMTLIPPEYAIKTDIKVLEFNMWTPQIVCIYISGMVALGICMFMASEAMFIAAAIMFAYALSNFLWPKYAKRIDLASKEHMVESLKGA